MAPTQDSDELKYTEPASIFKWTPICITPITPGAVTPAKSCAINLNFIEQQFLCLCQRVSEYPFIS